MNPPMELKYLLEQEYGKGYVRVVPPKNGHYMEVDIDLPQPAGCMCSFTGQWPRCDACQIAIEDAMESVPVAMKAINLHVTVNSTIKIIRLRR